MGLCASGVQMTEEEKRAQRSSKANSRQLDAAIADAHFKEQQINKLLLLGAGESGKSTLFKQMITIYGKGFTTEDCKRYVPVIYSNLVAAMKTLVQQSSQFGSVGANASASAEIVENTKTDAKVDSELAGHLQTLWADSTIQATYDKRATFQLTDSAAYFFDRLDEIGKDDYIPTEQDVLRSRVRTTGIIENEFLIDGNQFKMFDVGGQRNERKKWIHCFEAVTAVMFVAAISEYDQVLYEDENTNRMTEALQLFEEISNSRWFTETSMILFLNKRDLFEEKIKHVSLKQCFPEYTGGDDYQSGVDFISEEFKKLSRNPEKVVYVHVTCATDTDKVAQVFNAVKDILIRNSLNAAGLV